jgi:hypothetical protein
MGCFHSSENNNSLPQDQQDAMPGKWQSPELHQAVNQRKINTVPTLNLNSNKLHLRRVEKQGNDVETTQETMEQEAC